MSERSSSRSRQVLRQAKSAGQSRWARCTEGKTPKVLRRCVIELRRRPLSIARPALSKFGVTRQFIRKELSYDPVSHSIKTRVTASPTLLGASVYQLKLRLAHSHQGRW